VTDSTVLRLDGGLSTALEANGHSIGGSLWTGELLLSNPDAVTDAHRQFVEAGADIIITGSYQLSFEGGRLAGWTDDETERALRNSTTAARLAADEGTLVAASIGPYGAFLNDGSEFRGGYGVTDSVLRDFHDRRLDVLLSTQPDLFAIETMPDIGEVRVILDLLNSKDADIPFWVSFTVSAPSLVSGGGTFADACALVAEYPAAIAVGINCSPLTVVTPSLESLESELPFVVHPNAGQQWDSGSMSWTGEPVFATAGHIDHWVALGARIVGGCCGYGPAVYDRNERDGGTGEH
jgi:homocysteine S-methyltransferase